jgi:hypothetical protein
MMDLKKLKRLQRILCNEKDLGKIWLFYLDNFADYPEFTDLGEPIRHELLEEVIVNVLYQLFKRPFKDRFLLIRIPEYNFIHGPLTVGKRTGGIIYFEDAKKGLLAIEGDPGSGEVKYSRFSLERMTSSPQSWLN